MNPRDKREAFLVLNSVSGIGPVLLSRLLSFFESPLDVLEAERNDLMRVNGVGEELASSILGWRRRFDLERELVKMQQYGVRYVLREDNDYPQRLNSLPDAPYGLYVKGYLNLNMPTVAIVGTRNATLYGKATARRFAAGLARSGCLVVSGMALGIDAEAHWGALEAEGATAAVLGCGIDIVFPPANTSLYQKLGECGSLISEFSFGRRADRQTFPQRNRIVSGMADAVLVVETDDRGGSMITVKFAADQGRSVYAVPGRIDQETSKGCHSLIREGATLVTSVDDILDELRYSQLDLNFSRKIEKDGVARNVASMQDLSPAEQRVVRCFQGGAILHADSIVGEAGITQTEVLSCLMMLELKRVLGKRADGSYELL